MTIIPPDPVLVACEYLREVLPDGTTVSADLVGWRVGDPWVRVSRIGGTGMVWPYRHDDVALDVEVRAGSRKALADLRDGTRAAMLDLAVVEEAAGAVVVNAEEQQVFDMPHVPDEGYRSILTYHIVVRAN